MNGPLLAIWTALLGIVFLLGFLIDAVRSVERAIRNK